MTFKDTHTLKCVSSISRSRRNSLDSSSVLCPPSSSIPCGQSAGSVHVLKQSQRVLAGRTGPGGQPQGSADRSEGCCSEERLSEEHHLFRGAGWPAAWDLVHGHRGNG